MRVGILGSRGYPSTYGGFETLVRHVAPWLQSLGVDVSVYCRDGGPVTWRSAWHDGIRKIRTPGIETPFASTLSYGASASIDSIFRGFDSLLVVNVANGFFLPLAKARCRRVVVNVDGVEWERGKWNRLGKRVFRAGAAATARWAHEIVVDSRAMGDIWADELGREGTYIPYGADVIDERPGTRLEAVGAEPGAYVLVVARLVPENSVDLVLDALDRLDPDTQVVIAGRAPRRAAAIEDRLRRLSAQRTSVRWLGHVSDQELLTDLWFHCGVYVHGHSVGGTNPSLLQAMGAGAPVVAFDSAFNREVLGPEGIYFGPDPGALAERIATVMSDSAMRAAQAMHGRSVIADRYSWKACCDGYVDVLGVRGAEMLRSPVGGRVGVPT